MIIITGPQGTDEERGLIAEMAGFHQGLPAYEVVGRWAIATVLYCLAGWECCPVAVADVQIAETLGLPVFLLAV
ncbi:hypothetical protein ACGFZB_28820 [Streptomyces cinerochromogenes]|uniref:Uncharacterized protein n=1 Tax=Streptomyces cinerochromogenes TaxID=66422 RepID=A0ABW7BAX5_9ACTN